MSRTDLTDDNLAERLLRAFEAESADVHVSTEPFEPIRSSRDHGDVERSGGWRRPLLAGAAAIVVVGLAVGAVVLRTTSDGDDVPSTPADPEVEPEVDVDVEAVDPQADVGPPDGMLAPSFVPEDLSPWGVDWYADPRGVLSTQQLFQRADGAGLVVEVWNDGGGGTAWGDPVTVRGLPGATREAKERPDTDTDINWNEGASLTATYSGLTQSEAIALLDSLVWRSDDRTQGFASPSGGEFELRAENIEGAVTSSRPVLGARYRFADSPDSIFPGMGRQVEIRAATGPTSLANAADLQPLLHADARPDGVFESYDADFGTLTLQWPDGRYVVVDAAGTSVSIDELRAIADGIAPVDGDTVTALEAEISDALIEGSTLVSEAELPSGTVTVRRFVNAEFVCVTPSGGDELCPDLYTVGTPGETLELATSSLIVDGTWWVVGAGPPPLSAEMVPEPSEAREFGLSDGMAHGMAEADATVSRGEPWVRLGDPIPSETVPFGDGSHAVLVQPEQQQGSVIVVSGAIGESVRRPGWLPGA